MYHNSTALFLLMDIYLGCLKSLLNHLCGAFKSQLLNETLWPSVYHILIIRSTGWESRGERSLNPLVVPSLYSQLKRVWNLCFALSASIGSHCHISAMVEWNKKTATKDRVAGRHDPGWSPFPAERQLASRGLPPFGKNNVIGIFFFFF